MSRAGWVALGTAALSVLLILLALRTVPQPRGPDIINSEWKRGWDAAKYAIAEENSYARNAAIRVNERLNACLGRGKVWSDRHRVCDD